MRNGKWDEDVNGYVLRRGAEGWLERRRRDFWAAWLREQGRRLGRPPRVLEVGAGTGDLALGLAQAEGEDPLFTQWVGIEPLPNYVSYANRMAEKAALGGRVSFSVGRAEEAQPGTYDVLVSTDVLHHVEDVAQALRVLGSCAPVWGVMEPNAWHLYVFLCQSLRRGERNFWVRPFLNMAQREGWRCAGARYRLGIPNFITAPPAWLQRLEPYFETWPWCGGAVFLELDRL